MNCWKILGIEPDADKKSIKIAYSRLLKVTRPDDDPEGFERLHSAYKAALKATDSTQASTILEPGSDIDLAISPEPAEVISPEETTSASDPTNPDSFSEEYEAEWNHFESLVDEAVQDQHSANVISSWENVVNSPLVTDLQFKDRASCYVFDVVSEKNVLSLESDTLYVDSGALNHLNAHFSWGANWNQLGERFSSSRLDAVLPFLDEEEKYGPPEEARPSALSRRANTITSLLAIIAGYLNLNLFMAVTILAIPSTINRVYMRKWQTQNYGRVIGGEDELIEKNKVILFLSLFVAMWLVLLSIYGIGWAISYLVNLVST